MTVRRFRLISIFLTSTLGINSAMALPIDWTGTFGVDTHMLSNVCRTSDDVPAQFDPTTGNRIAPFGTQGITGDCDASFQTYLLKLYPQMIVNDGVTLKGEFSTGYLRGGFAGGDSTNTVVGPGNNSYFFTTPAQRSQLNINELYMELYADTALIKIGRMNKHYGLGIIFDAGEDPWDRFFTMYDGIEAEMKIGNFSIIPYYAKISSVNENNNPDPSGNSDVREIGLTAKYDNKNRDLVASVLYAKRSAESNNSFYNANTPTGVASRGETSVTVIEPYVAKKWKDLTVALEGSLQTGDYGDVYQDGVDTNAKISSSAFVLDVKYEINPKWDVGFTGGQVNGDDGETGSFDAVYLHPNYHIADLMFRYYYPSFAGGGERSIFDSSITNSRFYKVHGHYKTDKWIWKGALIVANALETASAGERAYQHEDGYAFESTYDQADDLGIEVDFGFDYRWNPNVVITGYYAYWKVGDYYSFTNTADELSLSNVHGGGLRATLEF